jgi:molybdate transport system ATP-binding protein
MSIVARFEVQRGAFCLAIDQVFAGQGVTAIFGPSGSGKTTLLRVLAGLERPPGGLLRVGDVVWQDGRYFLPPHRRAVGYVFQEANLFAHLRVRQNIEYGRRRLPAAARQGTLDDVIELLAIGHLLERRPHQLSGGEQQRVAIARALATQPAVLLMDEPLASLDAALKREIMPYLEALHREWAIPVLYVSHAREEVLRLADDVVLLEQGRVSGAGPVGEVLGGLGRVGDGDDEPQSMVPGVVVGRDAAFGLSEVAVDGGRLVLARDDLPEGRSVRLLIRAADVSLVLERPEATSIQNILPAVVERLEPAGASQADVLLRIGGTTLIARVTRKASVTLKLEPGTKLFAQIKSVSVMA